MKRRRSKHRKQSGSEVEQRRREEALAAHMRALGFSELKAYKAWRLAHGFGSGVARTDGQRARERDYVTRASADESRAAARRERRNRMSTISQIARGKLHRSKVRDPKLRVVFRAYEKVRDHGGAKLALDALTQHVASCTDLLRASPAKAQFGWRPGNTFAEALASVALMHQHWIRPLVDWRPRSHNAQRQFASLVRHLFVKYDVPAFMDHVWFHEPAAVGRRQQRWFIHIGQGKNIRTADLPLAYTKRMAHDFLQAPADYLPCEALRWGQIHGMGGDARLAEVIRGTRLSTEFGHDEFWASVLRFFIANPMLDPAQIGPIIDYLHQQKFVERQVLIEPGRLETRPPLQPNLTMKGRDPETLLRHVANWHRQLAKQSHPSATRWPASGIGGFSFAEGGRESNNLQQWTITELLSGKELIAEGRAMHHCVATYAPSCQRGQTAIWSMTQSNREGLYRVLTIELRLASRQICQARGKYNASPTPKAKKMLERWAQQVGLTVASYV